MLAAPGESVAPPHTVTQLHFSSTPLAGVLNAPVFTSALAGMWDGWVRSGLLQGRDS